MAVKHTTPESIDLQALFRRMLDAGDRSCAMEVSSHALALGRVEGTRFAAAAFTNLTQDHLDFHPTMEEYYAAKRRLFEGGGWPAADQRRRQLRPAAGWRAAGTGADLRRLRRRRPTCAPTRSRSAAGGAIALIARTPRGLLPLDVKLRGLFNVENVLCVVAIGELLELPHEAVRAGIASVAGVPGRFEPVDAGQPFTVLVDYAHTPDSLDNVLRAARAITAGSVICVFGCGGDRDRGKRPLMGAVARRLADRAIVTTDNPRSEDPAAIAAEITAGIEMEVELDRRRAIELAVAGGAQRRRGRDRRQGARAGPAVRRPDAAVRRPHRRARGADGHAGGDMIAIDSSEIVALTGGSGDVEAAVEGVTIDSRQVEPGDLFVALRGSRTDGVAHVDEALAKGAVAALVPRGAAGRDRIEVDDVLGRAGGDRPRGPPPVSARGWSASPGRPARRPPRTCCTRCWSRTSSVVASRQNENNELGVPLTLCRIERRHRGGGGRDGDAGDGRDRLPGRDRARPTSASSPASARSTWSCWAPSSRVAAAKAELLTALPADGVAIVPRGEPLLRPHLAELRCPVVSFGTRPGGRRAAGLVPPAGCRRRGGDRASAVEPCPCP